MMSSWSDMPVKHDDVMWCDNCKQSTTHNRTIYKDAEYRTCTRCHIKTTWTPDGKQLIQTSSSREDTSIKKYDQKRTRDHGKWRKRWKKGRPYDDDEQ